MFLVTMPVVIFVGKQFKDVPPPFPSVSSIFKFPGVWESQGYVGNWLVFFFLGFIMLYIVTSEVNFRTMRQNIITGLSRNEYFMSKLLVALALSVIATVYYAIIVLAIGYFHADPYSLEGAFDNDMAILRFFLMCMGYLSFAMLLAFLLRRSGLAIFFYTCYIIFIETIIKMFVGAKILKSDIVNFLPLNAIEDLMPNPLYKLSDYVPVKTADFQFLLTQNEAMVSSTIYILMFIGLAYWNFKRRDI